MLQALTDGGTRIHDVTSNSLLNSEYTTRIKEIKSELDSLDTSDLEWTIPVERFKELNRLNNTLDPSDSGFKCRITKAKRRKLESRRDVILSDKTFKREYERWDRRQKRLSKVSGLNNKLDMYNNLISDEIKRSVDFLVHAGALRDVKDHLELEC